MKNNGDNDSPKVNPEVANERKRQVDALFAGELCDENGNPVCCEQMVRNVCAQVFPKYKVSAFYSEEDLSHDVILRFLPHLSEYRGEADIKTVLYRIAENQLIDVVRKNRRSKTFSECQRDRDDGDNQDADHFLETLEVNRNYVEEQQENFILLDGFLTQLTAHQQFICRQIEEGQSLTDIAEMLGVKPQAVSNTKSRINRRWRAYLEGPDQGGIKCARV